MKSNDLVYLVKTEFTRKLCKHRYKNPCLLCSMFHTDRPSWTVDHYDLQCANINC